jgi:hypothetical protein
MGHFATLRPVHCESLQMSKALGILFLSRPKIS